MLTNGGKRRILVLTAMQTSIFAARFLRICSAANMHCEMRRLGRREDRQAARPSAFGGCTRVPLCLD